MDLICQVCQTLYQNPVTLECGHTFCLACLVEKCQTCNQAITDTPEENVFLEDLCLQETEDEMILQQLEITSCSSPVNIKELKPGERVIFKSLLKYVNCLYLCNDKRYYLELPVNESELGQALQLFSQKASPPDSKPCYCPKKIQRILEYALASHTKKIHKIAGFDFLQKGYIKVRMNTWEPVKMVKPYQIVNNNSEILEKGQIVYNTGSTLKTFSVFMVKNDCYRLQDNYLNYYLSQGNEKLLCLKGEDEPIGNRFNDADCLVFHQQTNSNLIEVFCKTLTGMNILITISLDASGIELKEKIAQNSGYPYDATRIIFAGRQLDDKTVKEYGIRKEATIHMVLRLSGS